MAKVMNYRILLVAEDGVTVDIMEKDSVTVKYLQDLHLFYAIFNLRYRVLRRNAQNGKWFLYHSNQHILEVK